MFNPISFEIFKTLNDYDSQLVDLAKHHDDRQASVSFCFTIPWFTTRKQA